MTNFIQIPNVFFIDGELKLTPEELYIYSYIKSNELYLFRNSTNISIDLLASQVTMRKKVDQNKNLIKKLLKQLNDKEVISINNVSVDNIKNNILLNIEYQPMAYYSNFSEKYKNGFEQIPLDVLYSVNELKEIQKANYFYVLAYILKNKKSKNQISYYEWASILGVNDKTAIEIIDSMANLNLIERYIGSYYLNENEQVRQEINKYHVITETFETVKEEVQPIQEKEPLHSVEVQEKEENKEERSHNWYVANSRLTDDDFYIYLTTQDEKLKEHCDRRIKAISKTDKGRSLVMALKGKAESIINKREMEKEIMNAKSEMYVAKLENKREVKYKKKKFDDDISGFLDDFKIDIEEQQPKQNREPKFLEPEFDEFEEEYEKARKEHEAKMYLPDNDDLDDFNWGGEDPTNFNEFDENESVEYQKLQMQINYM